MGLQPCPDEQETRHHPCLHSLQKRAIFLRCVNPRKRYEEFIQNSTHKYEFYGHMTEESTMEEEL